MTHWHQVFTSPHILILSAMSFFESTMSGNNHTSEVWEFWWFFPRCRHSWWASFLGHMEGCYLVIPLVREEIPWLSPTPTRPSRRGLHSSLPSGGRRFHDSSPQTIWKGATQWPPFWRKGNPKPLPPLGNLEGSYSVASLLGEGDSTTLP